MFLNEKVLPKVAQWFESAKRTLKQVAARLGIGRRDQAETVVTAEWDEEISKAA